MPNSMYKYPLPTERLKDEIAELKSKLAEVTSERDDLLVTLTELVPDRNNACADGWDEGYARGVRDMQDLVEVNDYRIQPKRINPYRTLD